MIQKILIILFCNLTHPWRVGEPPSGSRVPEPWANQPNPNAQVLKIAASKKINHGGLMSSFNYRAFQNSVHRIIILCLLCFNHFMNDNNIFFFLIYWTKIYIKTGFSRKNLKLIFSLKKIDQLLLPITQYFFFVSSQ